MAFLYLSVSLWVGLMIMKIKSRFLINCQSCDCQRRLHKVPPRTVATVAKMFSLFNFRQLNGQAQKEMITL